MGRRRVLIIDDDAPARRALQTILEEEGYDVCAAGSGQEALRSLTSFAPEVILTDLHLPDVTGVALLRRLRERGSQVPLMIMTGTGSPEEAREAREAGASSVLRKPLDVDMMLASVAQATGLAK